MDPQRQLRLVHRSNYTTHCSKKSYLVDSYFTPPRLGVPEAGTLREQLDSIRDYLFPWFNAEQFPIILGGEHGLLPPVVEALRNHSRYRWRSIGTNYSLQVDAHADLRDSLNGERFSHGTAARRSLDYGIGGLLQIGIRAYSLDEAKFVGENSKNRS